MHLREKLKKYNIILATGSPRRQEFFKEFGIDFEIRLKEIDEHRPEVLKAEDFTDHIAEQKSIEYEDDLQDNDILITCDTVVWFGGMAIGKPDDYTDAFCTLKMLSEKSHEVITSVCFKTTKKMDIIHEVTKVHFGELTDSMIHYYLRNYKPFDKAGSYGIQEWLGMVGVKKIVGSYNNVVGFPSQKVYEYLMNYED